MINIVHIETDITQHCNMQCVGCNHDVPLWRTIKGGPWTTTPEQVEHDLFYLSKVLHADIWGALGGEPLISKHLIDILHVARESHIADKIEVWTNGILLPRMSEEFWRSFDVLVLSVYPGKHSELSLEWITAKCKDSGVELSLRDERINPNFRSLLEPVPTDPITTRHKFQNCFFRQFSRSVNYGYFYTCCCWGIPMLLQGKEHGIDGIKVEGITEDDLRAYLERTEPLGACTVCAGRDTAVPIKWREERDPVKWVEASKGLMEAGV